jgi:hypothetical protein
VSKPVNEWDAVFAQANRAFKEADRAFEMADEAFEKDARTGKANFTFGSNTEEHSVRFTALTYKDRWKNFWWFGRKAFSSLFHGTAVITFKRK